ncbi:MAG: helix-turn-helix domain-containing protein, partial [Desulfotomaculales bacterium]
PSYLSEIERGAKKPSLKTLKKIASALNVPSSCFFEDGQVHPGLAPGEKIRLLRTEKKLSLQETARQAGLSASYLSDVERGAVFPSLDTIRRMARVLETSPAVLLGQEMFLGFKLRALREEQGLTQARLAEMTGVTPGMIGQIEQGKVQPSLKTLEKISRAMGVSPCYFLTETDSVEQVIGALNPELRRILLHPNVQAALALLCDLKESELQFILNFIILYKKAGLGPLKDIDGENNL